MRTHRHIALACALLLALALAAHGCAPGDRTTASPSSNAPISATAATPADATPATTASAHFPIDPPPIKLPLVDDAEWSAALARQMKHEPNSESGGHGQWLEETMGIAFYARDFARGERCVRDLIAQYPHNWHYHDLLSWVLGKQGRYQEALDEAATAGALPEADSMQVAAMSASWLWHLGQHDQARARFAAIPVPAEDSPAWPLYQGCRACFAASSHDLATMQNAIRILMDISGREELFLRRDVIFDQYRGEKWFRDLVGETLIPVKKDAL